jgi:hypothetical protein
VSQSARKVGKAVRGIGEAAMAALGIPSSTLESRIRRLGVDKHAIRRRVAGR